MRQVEKGVVRTMHALDIGCLAILQSVKSSSFFLRAFLAMIAVMRVEIRKNGKSISSNSWIT